MVSMVSNKYLTPVLTLMVLLLAKQVIAQTDPLGTNPPAEEDSLLIAAPSAAIEVAGKTTADPQADRERKIIEEDDDDLDFGVAPGEQENSVMTGTDSPAEPLDNEAEAETEELVNNKFADDDEKPSIKEAGE